MQPIFLINGIFPAYYGGEPGFKADQIAENLAYVIDGAGWKLFKRNGVSTALIPIDSVSGINAEIPYIEFSAKKIPYSLVEKVVAFFKAVFRKYQSEAVGYLYYNPTTFEWDYVVPKQSASGAHASYEGAPKLPGWQCAGTIHSHAALSAFHSGTDDADEINFDGVHITVGRVSDLNPEFSCSLVIQGKRTKFEIYDLVAGFPMPTAPVEWVNLVKLSAPSFSFDWDKSVETELRSLYDLYYTDQMSEIDYLKELKKIQQAAEKIAEKKRTEQQFDFDQPKNGKHKSHKKNQVWPQQADNDFNFSLSDKGGEE